MKASKTEKIKPTWEFLTINKCMEINSHCPFDVLDLAYDDPLMKTRVDTYIIKFILERYAGHWPEEFTKTCKELGRFPSYNIWCSLPDDMCPQWIQNNSIRVHYTTPVESLHYENFVHTTDSLKNIILFVENHGFKLSYFHHPMPRTMTKNWAPVLLQFCYTGPGSETLRSKVGLDVKPVPEGFHPPSYIKHVINAESVSDLLNYRLYPIVVENCQK